MKLHEFGLLLMQKSGKVSILSIVLLHLDHYIENPLRQAIRNLGGHVTQCYK